MDRNKIKWGDPDLKWRDKNSIIFTILPDSQMKTGRAVLIVSPEDFERMEQSGWNMSRPTEEYSCNMLRIKNGSDIESKSEAAPTA